MKLLRTASLLCVLVVSIIGCQSMTGKTAGENIDDATITAWVKSKLVAERASNLTRVDVDTERGTVYLTGSVADENAKARALQLARGVKGVRGVVDNLRVSQP